MSEDLSISQVHQKLDAKFKIGGLDALDLLLALIFGAIMNFVFGGTILEIPLVIGGPTVIIGFLLVFKKGKPEKYLSHLAKYYLEPGFLSAAKNPVNINEYRRKIYEPKSS